MSHPQTHPWLYHQHRRARRKRDRRRPVLWFSPYAWAKLLCLRDAGPTEVGGFGIAAPDNLLCVRDIALVRQTCTEVFVAFDDAAVADFFEHQIGQGRRPDQVGRIWIHTHPGNSPKPSSVDRETFLRVFGHCDWAVMFILARHGATHAELHWRQGGPARIPLEVEIDYSRPFAASDCSQWHADHAAAIQDQWTSFEPQHESHVGGEPPFDQSAVDILPADWFACEDVVR